MFVCEWQCLMWLAGGLEPGTYIHIYQYSPHDRADCICAGGGGWNMVLGQAKADCMRL